MALYYFEERGIKELMESLTNVSEALKGKIWFLLDNAVKKIHKEVTDRTPINTGMLRKHIDKEVITEWNKREVEGRVFVKGLPIQYWYYVEKGRRPGKMPPHEPIRLWVKRKLHPHFEISEGRWIRRKPGGEREIDRITWAIRRKIGREGTKGYEMFKKGFEASKPYLERIYKMMAEIIEKELEK
jgi:hypothetical protein